MSLHINILFAALSLTSVVASPSFREPPQKKVKQRMKIISPVKKHKEGNPDEFFHITTSKGVSEYPLSEFGLKTVFRSDSVKFNGYDKQLTSAKESIFITNHTFFFISSVDMKIIYSDCQDRMLHTRTVKLKCNLPPMETRKIDFPSWDRQNSFYYVKSNVPRRAATPYKIKILPVAYSIAEPGESE